METETPQSTDPRPWYVGITGYEWTVLIIASAGWVFDVYESQIFNITRDQMLREILGSEADLKWWGDVFLGIFLFGGSLGGLAFGSLADRFGRRNLMIASIVLYAVFSGLTYFATELWQVAVLRLLVSIGIGGEWAVAASLVAEVFPARARAQASGIFHTTSVLGTWLAAAAAIAVGAQWRYAYLIGVLPALLVVWVRASVREPDRWEAERTAAQTARPAGSFVDLLTNPRWMGSAILGILLATVGLGTFWAVTVAGQDLARDFLSRRGVALDDARAQAKFAYGIVQAAGGGLGLLAFGPLSARWGRRTTFVVFHLAALAVVPLTCHLPQSYFQLLLCLPVYGFCTMGMHAGYAVYFPELFPTYLRATGASFCFNGGRLLAVPVLLFSGWLKNLDGMDLRLAIIGLSLLYLLGIPLILAMPETRGKDLPE